MFHGTVSGPFDENSSNSPEKFKNRRERRRKVWWETFSFPSASNRKSSCENGHFFGTFFQHYLKFTIRIRVFGSSLGVNRNVIQRLKKAHFLTHFESVSENEPFLAFVWRCRWTSEELPERPRKRQILRGFRSGFSTKFGFYLLIFNFCPFFGVKKWPKS